MVKLKINGKKVKAKEGATVLEAARANGIEIPTLCSNEALKPYGACRLCIVEIGKSGSTSVDTSCTYPVEEGLEVKTNTPRIVEGRKMVIELHLARCPNVKIIRQLADEYGIEESAKEMGKDNEYCILCGLCVRACNEVVKAGAIQFTGRGANKVVDSPFNQKAEDCIACGSCAFVCPTGIIEKNDLASTSLCSPEGCEPTGPQREILNWKVEHKLKECKKCGNPYAPEPHLEKVRQEQNLPNEFFDICPPCRQYPVIDEDKCLGCGGCMENCPCGALELEDKGGYDKKSHVYTQNCTACHSCEPLCPVQAIS
jgi:NAD-dependent dihydropyrimidine dehydrogenase PreA subunit/ferredoxin